MTPLEYIYKGVAREMRDPMLCYKISPSATDSYPLATSGIQIMLVRSDCLDDVALATRNPDLCDEVVPVSTSLLDGSAINADNCRSRIASGRNPDGIIGEDRELILRLLGYISESEPVGESADRAKLFNLHARSPDFSRRAAELPDFTSGIDEARNDAYMLLPYCRDNPRTRDGGCKLLDCALIRDAEDRFAQCGY